jgi:hypothetical protein
MTNRRVLVAFGVALILASLAVAASPRARNSQITQPVVADRSVSLAIQLPQAAKPAALPSNFAATTLYEQTSNGYGGIAAQNFEAAYNAYDVFIADDFVVTGGPWTIDQVTFPGIFWNGYTFNIDAANVWFYQNSAGHPGAEVKSYMTHALSSAPNAPNVVVQFCGDETVLDNGTYWVAVNVDMAFGPYGQWGSMTHTPVVNSESNWKNPNGGFGMGCPNWNYRCTVCGVCIAGDNDQAFKLEADACGGGAGGGGGSCDLTPIEAKLDDEIRFTDDTELAVIEGKLDNINVSVDWCELIDLLLPLLHETLPTTHPCYP